MHNKPGRRILLVDDDKDTLDSVKEILQLMAGAEVMTAQSGLEALTKMALNPEAVVTDYRMPGMDGLELTRRLHENRPKLPVVMITAYGQEFMDEDARKAGVCVLVPKPIEIKQLMGAIDSCCEAAGL